MRADSLSRYTDGSVLNDNVEAAFVIFKYNGVILKVKKNIVQQITTPSLMVLFKALQFIEKVEETSNCMLITDSMSVLEALANPDNKIPLIFKIKQTIISIISFTTLSSYHIKSHSEIFGNELADQIAASARRYG